MTEVTTRFEQPVTGPAQSAATVPPKSAQTLITEQQVMFSTAAAAAVSRGSLVSAPKPPARRRFPKRHVWLENSLMSREMDRL